MTNGEAALPLNFVPPNRIGVDDDREREDVGRRFYYALTSSLGLDQGQVHALLGLDCHGRSHHQPPNTNFCRAAAEAVATLTQSRRCSAADGWLLLAGKLQSLANSGRLEEPAESGNDRV